MDTAQTFRIKDAVMPKHGALRGEIGYIVKLGKRPWADVQFPKVGRLPYRFPLTSLEPVDKAGAR